MGNELKRRMKAKQKAKNARIIRNKNLSKKTKIGYADEYELKVHGVSPDMKLYKYIKSEWLLALLKTSTIRYTQPAFLNDPYECHLTIDRESVRQEAKKFRDGMATVHPEISSDELDKYENNFDVTYPINFLEMYRHLRDDHAVLSLSQDPLNLLMWSHYAD